MPAHAPTEVLGLLVALHGHGGNVALWLHAWRPFAIQQRLVIVCPTFGYGNWEHPAGVRGINRAVAYALEHFPIDATRIYLAGLSQGGAGVTRAGLDPRFAGLIALSPTLEPKVLMDEEFITAWQGRPIFVAQGGTDRNVRPQSVDDAVAMMSGNGAVVTYWRVPAADHFLFFAKRAELFRRLGAWMTVGVVM